MKSSGLERYPDGHVDENLGQPGPGVVFFYPRHWLCIVYTGALAISLPVSFCGEILLVGKSALEKRKMGQQAI